MEEAFDMWNRCKGDDDYALRFEDWWERDVEAMAGKDCNHPCVLFYSLGNEIPEIALSFHLPETYRSTAMMKASTQPENIA